MDENRYMSREEADMIPPKCWATEEEQDADDDLQRLPRFNLGEALRGIPGWDASVTGHYAWLAQDRFGFVTSSAIRLYDKLSEIGLFGKLFPDTHKVLAPGHGFNSERSQRAENGGRP
jgi:hypothetical protein